MLVPSWHIHIFLPFTKIFLMSVSETVKMRSVSRGDAGTPPPISSTQAVRNLYLDHCCYFSNDDVINLQEDDLRWVEENLPTTAMDK